ncbi:MAG: ClbS/DfsB family four-helix bundle protein [Rhizobiales bacterium]|nr:ClbS/DfsB family four-helix bundle protein [Hyphomicrobiales bacterium]MBO6698742.1 ClbS/DfsB family four-helix bundle protein [Hyphomicrobiales bacterium]MBO6735005.1 ClbS/DfsB family four-helix bundle protein [Hyphomicrobiales bacterium]MBO6911189.1 ClbS/DfsB family four-helix bundle protein [Hyphomicrobiales bacterium]MBO6955699.1 ClbS/DfsB family four-helix bundle protein [Hyphomicrobiales bacterium]
MAAIDKNELRAVTEKEFAKLIKLLDGLDEDLAERPDTTGGVSIKQVIGHRVHWMDLFFGWYEDGKAGKEVQTPAPGYKWNQLKPYNATVYEAAAKQPWSDVLAQLKERHAKLLAFIDGLDNDVLYAKHIYPWTNDWALGRWAESSGPSHYRSAAKFVRKVKRDAAP